MEIRSWGLFLLLEDIKIFIFFQAQKKKKRRREAAVQASEVLRILLSSKCRIETDILYFPLNYTSSKIHFETVWNLYFLSGITS